MTTSATTTPLRPTVADGRHLVLALGGASTGSGAEAWAAREAARLGLPIALVSAVPAVPGSGRSGRYGTVDVATVQRDAADARQRLEESAARLTDTVPVAGVHVDEGWPAQAILEHAGRDTPLLVLGHRLLGASARLLEGSTAIAVAGRSPVPVAVVPDGWSAPGDGADDPRPVTVGLDVHDVDGELRTDEHALDVAFERAQALGVPLTAVHAWQVPALLSWSPADVASYGRRAGSALEELLAPWSARHPDVEVFTRVVAGRPCDVVEDAARGSQVLVLGRHTTAHRHGGFHLGSTTRQALHHVAVPVLVVPEEVRS